MLVYRCREDDRKGGGAKRTRDTSDGPEHAETASVQDYVDIFMPLVVSEVLAQVLLPSSIVQFEFPLCGAQSTNQKFYIAIFSNFDDQ